MCFFDESFLKGLTWKRIEILENGNQYEHSNCPFCAGYIRVQEMFHYSLRSEQ